MDIDLEAIINANFNELQRSTYPSVELLGRLQYVEFFRAKIAPIKQKKTVDEMNISLLECLSSVPRAKRSHVLEGFLKALRSTGQDHVANMFRKESDHIPMSEAHYNKLIYQRDKLRQFMDPSDDLTDKLVAAEVLRLSEKNTIHSQQTTGDMAGMCIDIIMRKSDCSFDKFVTALASTKQEHVAGLLRDGYTKVPISDEHRDLLTSRRSRLCKFMDPVNGLITELVSAKVFNAKDDSQIRSVGTLDGMVNEFLNILVRKSDCAYYNFLTALHNTRQTHVLHILTGEDVPPVQQKYVDQMVAERVNFIAGVEPTVSSLLDMLVSEGVFSCIDKERVEAAGKCDSARNAMIIDLMMRKSQPDFEKFIISLSATGHPQAAISLKGKDIIAKFQLKYDINVSVDCRNGIRIDLKKVIAKLRDFDANDANVDSVRQTLESNSLSVSQVGDGSIEMHFRCFSGTSLANLKRLYTTGILENMFQKEYGSLYTERGLVAMKLQIADNEFDRCEKMFAEFAWMTHEHRQALLMAEKLLISITDELLKKITLCPRRRQAIQAADTTDDKLKTLLRILTHQPDSKFLEFISALEGTGQHEAAEFLKNAATSIGCPEVVTSDKCKVSKAIQNRDHGTELEGLSGCPGVMGLGTTLAQGAAQLCTEGVIDVEYNARECRSQSTFKRQLKPIGQVEYSRQADVPQIRHTQAKYVTGLNQQPTKKKRKLL